jgi:hypothetical protein
MPDNQETKQSEAIFDFTAYPPDTLFHERRTVLERRQPDPPVVEAKPNRERRARTERRRRVDPTTFEKQYSPEELEFMNAMQQFKLRSGKPFPSYGEVLQVAMSLGYRRLTSRSHKSSAKVLVPDIDESEQEF